MKNKLPMLFVLLAGIFWGIISIFVRGLSALGLTSLQVSSVRLLVATVVMFFILLLTDPKRLKINLKDAPIFIGTGIIGMVFMNWFYLDTIVKSQVGFASVMLYTAPVFVMIASVFLFREKITPLKILALFLAVGGCVCVSGLLSADAAAIPGSAFLTGILSGICYAAYTILCKFAVRKYHVFTVSFYSFLLGAIVSAIMGNLPAALPAVCSLEGVLHALGLGIPCTVVAALCYSFGLKGMDASRASIIVSVELLIGSVVGVILYHEQVTMLKILGVCFVLASVVLLNIRETDGKTDGEAEEEQNEITV